MGDPQLSGHELMVFDKIPADEWPRSVFTFSVARLMLRGDRPGSKTFARFRRMCVNHESPLWNPLNQSSTSTVSFQDVGMSTTHSSPRILEIRGAKGSCNLLPCLPSVPFLGSWERSITPWMEASRGSFSAISSQRHTLSGK